MFFENIVDVDGIQFEAMTCTLTIAIQSYAHIHT